MAEKLKLQKIRSFEELKVEVETLRTTSLGY
jgi:hypothetical protein